MSLGFKRLNLFSGY